MKKTWGDIKRVLLVLPDERSEKKGVQPLFNRIWQPLDLANIAGLLEAKGVFVRIIDNRVERLSPEKLGALGQNFDANCVTSAPYDRWQCPPLHIRSFFETAQLFPKEKTILFGPHVTERPETFLRQTGARVAVLGEPEMTLLELLTCEGNQENLREISGLAFFKDNVFVRTRPKRGSELATLSKPAFHLLSMTKYHYSFMEHPFTLLEGSRGCPFHCKFCYKGMFPGGYRQKKPDDLAAEVAKVKAEFGIRSVYFMDLEFGLDRDFLISFCRRMIAMKNDVTWCCQTRAKDLDSTTLALMRQAGCTLIHMGVESGSPDILKKSGKAMVLNDCQRAIMEAKHQGIRTALFFNCGFPGETEEDRAKTLDAAIKLDPTYAAFHMLIPYPGTAWAKEQMLDTELSSPGHYPSFFHTCHDERTLKAWVRKAYGKFYLRPAAIIRMMTGEKQRLPEKLVLFFRFWIK